MIQKVLHHMSRTFMYPRSFYQISRTLHHLPNRLDVLVPEHRYLRVSRYSDFVKHVTIRDKPKFLTNSSVSPNYPQIMPKLMSSSKHHEIHDSKKADSQKEKLKTTSTGSSVEPLDDDKNLSIFKRFKKMYRDYWYVLVPVHVITSLGWFGGFYYMAKSGVDIVAIVETLGVSDHIPDILKDSKAGYLAVSYALYKIATPVRYMVTIGGTTISIKYLKECGYIKPIPPKEKLKEMYQERKENFKEKRQHFADELKLKKEQFKERRQTLMRERRQDK